MGANAMRYLVFGGSEYYPGGGIQDLVGSFDDLAQAVARMRELREPDEWSYTSCDWVHVYDVQAGTTHYLSDFDSHGS